MVVSFFNLLYKDDGYCLDTASMPKGTFPRIHVEDILKIQEMASNDEIKEVVFSMGSLKAPNPNGLHVIFF